MAKIRTKTHHLFLHRGWCKIGIMHGNAPRYGWPLPKRTAIFMIRYAQKRTNISKKTLVKKRVAEGATLFGSCGFTTFLVMCFPAGSIELGMHQNAPEYAPKRTCVVCCRCGGVCVYVCVWCVWLCVYLCVCVRWLNAMIRELAETFNENSTFEC